MLTTYEPSMMGETSKITVNADPLIFQAVLADQRGQIGDFIVMALTDLPNYLKLKMLLNDPQIMELSELLLYSIWKHPDFGLPFVEVVSYEETEEPIYVNLLFENCNWEEWKSLEEELILIQDLLKGLVAITCIRGLTE